jgi:hypothetical protein
MLLLLLFQRPTSFEVKTTLTAKKHHHPFCGRLGTTTTTTTMAEGQTLTREKSCL